MKSRILDSSYVVDFIGFGFDSADICAKKKVETDKILASINDKKLNNWEVHFIYRYNNVKQILIYTRGKSYLIEKYKEITIHIPIPIKEKASWGVDLEQHIYKNENHLDSMLKNFNCLDVDYSNFTNRKEYILDCMERSIEFCFKKGFTVNGVKIKR